MPVKKEKISSKKKTLPLYLKKLENEKQSKPIFIFQHKHPILHKNLNNYL